jgi:hypothetical protein
VDEAGVTLGRERVPFAELVDASIDGSVLTLREAGGRLRQVRVRDGFAVLGAILDGIRRAHPERSIYRSPSPAFEAPQSPGTRPARLRRRVATAGTPDRWIGRTLYH